MGTAQQEISVADRASEIKVYLVMLSEVYFLESRETWQNFVVSGVFMSRNAANEFIDYHKPYLLAGDQYFIREELVRS
jgi:hypothetical protein